MYILLKNLPQGNNEEKSNAKFNRNYVGGD